MIQILQKMLSSCNHLMPGQQHAAEKPLPFLFNSQSLKTKTILSCSVQHNCSYSVSIADFFFSVSAFLVVSVLKKSIQTFSFPLQ